MLGKDSDLVLLLLCGEVCSRDELGQFLALFLAKHKDNDWQERVLFEMIDQLDPTRLVLLRFVASSTRS